MWQIGQAGEMKQVHTKPLMQREGTGSWDKWTQTPRSRWQAQGAETRPVAFLVQVASQFESSIYIEYDNKRINAKSIMGMMTVNLSNGKEVNVSADGSDEAEAITKIEEYLKKN